MSRSVLDRLFKAINPQVNPLLTEAVEKRERQLPLLWLLGKTGAGKSSIVQGLTGCSAAEVGNGFSPCTQSAVQFPFPNRQPVMRFLDTRGLDEAGYSADEDLKEAETVSSALLAVVRLADPQQTALINALRHVKQQHPEFPLLLVLTACEEVSLVERERVAAVHRNKIAAVWKTSFPSVQIDFDIERGELLGKEPFEEAVVQLMPMLHWLSNRSENADQEQQNFNVLRKEILWYAGAAATTDTLPAVALVAVPSIQGKMLHSLAAQYGVEWDRQRFAEFATALGSGIALQYSASFGVRQLAKLIPVYGQTVGAAAAAVVAFATTYALGRGACYYLYKISRGERVDPEQLQTFYREAMKRGEQDKRAEESSQ